MRFCGTFRRRSQLSCPKERNQAGRAARKAVRSTFFAVDYADDRSALETGLTEGLDRGDGRPAGGDDVLDQADPLTRLEGALEAVRGAVLLGFLADDDERQARDERRGGCDRDGAELGCGEPNCVRLVLGHQRRQLLSERLEQLRPRLEAVLVEVVARGATGAKHEVALEGGGLADPRRELVALHCAARSASRAYGITTAASGEPPAIETMEPSSK